MQLQISDDSMAPALDEGDIVDVIKTKRLEVGCIYLLTICNRPMIRLYTEDKAGYLFTPLNLQWYKPEFVRRERRKDIKVCGRIETTHKKLYLDPSLL